MRIPIELPTSLRMIRSSTSTSCQTCANRPPPHHRDHCHCVAPAIPIACESLGRYMMYFKTVGRRQVPVARKAVLQARLAKLWQCVGAAQHTHMRPVACEYSCSGDTLVRERSKDSLQQSTISSLSLSLSHGRPQPQPQPATPPQQRQTHHHSGREDCGPSPPPTQPPHWTPSRRGPSLLLRGGDRGQRGQSRRQGRR